MPTLTIQGISFYYELIGDPRRPAVLLISGLGGVGKSWGPQAKLFAERYHVIVPDQRGTGRSTHAEDGYTIAQLAADAASLVQHLAVGPVHVVGSSTGGAIAQCLALDHPHLVRSLTIASSFARFDAFMRREFEVRRKMASEWDRRAMFEGYALFLFSPRFTREHPDRVAEWIDQAASSPAQAQDRAISLKRIDMIAAHDVRSRLGEIAKPTLVLCADNNFCTPLPLSEEIAAAVPGAELVVIQDAGELIELETPHRFFDIVNTFIERHQ